MKTRMLKAKQEVQMWCKQNKAFTVVLMVQALVVLYFLAQCFVPQTVIDVPLESFAKGVDIQAVNIDEDGLYIQNDVETTEPIGLQSDLFALPRGAYLLKVNYKSVYNLAQPSGSMLEETAAVVLQTQGTQSLFVQMDNLKLKDSTQSVEGRIWVSYGQAVDTAQLGIYYNGEGQAQIYSVLIEEQMAYRWMTLLGVCLMFAICNVGGYCFCSIKPAQYLRQSKAKVFCALLGIAVLANLPLFANYLYNGADLIFHTVRIDAVATALSQGQFPVRLAPDMMNGYGYVNSIFYCDIFLYLPAVLYNCMIPLRMTYQIYMLLVNFFTVAIAYYCFKKMLNDSCIAIVGAASYTLASYRLANVYVRAGVGECAALMFFPLIIFGLWNVYREEKPSYRDWLPLSIGVAGVVQSHILSVEIVVAFLVLFCLLTFKQTICLARIKGLLCAVGLCMGLCAWFLLPFVQSMITMDLNYTTTIAGEIQSRGLDILELFSFGGASSRLGWGLLVGLLVAAYVLSERNRWNAPFDWNYRALQCSLAVGGIATLVSLENFPWNAIGYGLHPAIAGFINVIQYPMRVLAVATVCFVFAMVIALRLVKQYKPRFLKPLLCTIVAINIAFTGLYYIDFTEYAEKKVMNELGILPSPLLIVGGGEYLIKGSDAQAAMCSLVQTSDNAVEIIDYQKVDGVARLSYRNTSEESQTILLPVWNYPNYQATDNETGELLTLVTGENNRMELTVPAGKYGDVVVEYIAPWYWHLAELITLMSWAFVGTTFYYTQRSVTKQSNKGNLHKGKTVTHTLSEES